jgi:hypothetical protein
MENVLRWMTIEDRDFPAMWDDQWAMTSEFI